MNNNDKRLRNHRGHFAKLACTLALCTTGGLAHAADYFINSGGGEILGLVGPRFVPISELNGVPFTFSVLTDGTS